MRYLCVQDKETALHCLRDACGPLDKVRACEVTRALLEAKADVNAIDQVSTRPLCCAPQCCCTMF